MKYLARKNRRNTDIFFFPELVSQSYSGKAADAARLIEADQLMDPALWALFVAQFRIGNVDDHDLGWRIEYWGKMMRGACFTYSYTQNEALYGILETSVRDIMTARDSFGRITTYSIEKNSADGISGAENTLCSDWNISLKSVRMIPFRTKSFSFFVSTRII